jgi:GT2 family glycosyltransferase
VIDSASFDGCDVMLRERFPRVRFIQSETNLGFAGANNRAFEASTGHAVLFLNPDTELIGPAIDTLYAELQARPDAGTVGGKLLNGDGTVQESCVQSVPTLSNQLLGAEFLRQRWPHSPLWGMAALHQAGVDACEVQAISGACVMLRRKVFEESGRFSTDYFMYAEDMELSYNARRAGYRNYYVPRATVTHFGGSSSQQVSTFAAVMLPEAIWRFLRKTRGRAYGLGYRVGMFASALGRLSLLGLADAARGRTASSAASRRSGSPYSGGASAAMRSSRNTTRRADRIAAVVRARRSLSRLA